MYSVEIARGIVGLGVEYYSFSFETIEELMHHFKCDHLKSVTLETLSIYDERIKEKTIKVEDLTIHDINWVNSDSKIGSRYLRGWKS